MLTRCTPPQCIGDGVRRISRGCCVSPGPFASGASMRLKFANVAAHLAHFVRIVSSRTCHVSLVFLRTFSTIYWVLMSNYISTGTPDSVRGGQGGFPHGFVGQGDQRLNVERWPGRVSSSSLRRMVTAHRNAKCFLVSIFLLAVYAPLPFPPLSCPANGEIRLLWPCSNAVRDSRCARCSRDIIHAENASTGRRRLMAGRTDLRCQVATR